MGIKGKSLIGGALFVISGHSSSFPVRANQFMQGLKDRN